VKSVGIIAARARLSAIVAEAEKGEPVLLTRHGREAAMLVPIAIGRKLFPKPAEQLSFAALLAPAPRKGRGPRRAP
jgi:prevent-host-death family protein